MSGYLIPSQAVGTHPLSPAAEQAWWYQYYFATERGRRGYLEHRRGFAKPRFDDLENRLATRPAITVPTISLEGDANGVPHPDPVTYAGQFTGRYEHCTLTGGIGHNPWTATRLSVEF